MCAPQVSKQNVVNRLSDTKCLIKNVNKMSNIKQYDQHDKSPQQAKANYLQH